MEVAAASPHQVAVDVDKSNAIGTSTFEPVISSLYGRFQIEDVNLSDNSSVSVMNIDRSVLILRASCAKSSSLASLFVQNIKGSLLICNQASSGTHITNASRSTMIVRGRQVRIHAATDCIFYLHSGSHPIIEACWNVKFAPLPHAYVGTGISYGKMDSDLSDQNREDDQSVNFWNIVDDFQWLRPGPSPHWGVLAPDDQHALREEEWNSLIEVCDGRQDVEQVLRLAKIPLLQSEKPS